MAYLKWQEAVQLLGKTATVIFTIMVVLNLAGMSYSIPPDIICEEDCYSQIQVNSSFWEICVEHSGESPILYKKMTRSRRLWLNLDKIDNVLETDPIIPVELLVPTISKYATIKNEYGYLRPVKDGDCIIKRQTRSRPQGSRIIIHGSKKFYQDVKWGFNLGSFYSKDITMDPLWKGVRDKYTPGSETHCDEDGRCILTLYSGVQFVDENGTRFENASSVKKFIKKLYLQKDDRYDLEIIAANFSYLHVNLTIDENLVGSKVPIKICKRSTDKCKKFEFLFRKSHYEIELSSERIQNLLDYNFTIGKGSTTLVLQDADTENLEDAEFDEDSAGQDGSETYAVIDLLDGTGEAGVVKFNISAIPASQTIDWAEYCWVNSYNNANSDFYLWAFNGSDDGFSQTWVEDTLDDDLDVSANFYGNSTVNFGYVTLTGTGTACYNTSGMAEFVQLEYDNNRNVSFSLNGTSGIGYARMNTKEWATAGERPKLTIAYSSAADVTKPYFSTNSTNATVVSTPCNFSIIAHDETAVDFCIFSTNNSGTWINATPQDISGTQATCENVTTLNGTTGALVQWKYYANDTSDNWNTSQTFNLTTTAADTCTPPSNAEWVVSDACTKTASVNNCPYGINITSSGSLNMTGSGVVLNTSHIYWSPISGAFSYRLNWENGAKVYWGGCT